MRLAWGHVDQCRSMQINAGQYDLDGEITTALSKTVGTVIVCGSMAATLDCLCLQYRLSAASAKVKYLVFGRGDNA